MTITTRFRALSPDGIGYMYTAERANKPVHPIVEKIRSKKQSSSRLIPRGNNYTARFWLPPTLWDEPDLRPS